jgi:hypothetical protein
VTETARIILTAAVLSGLGLGALTWRVTRTDPEAPDRLVGQLRVAQLAALVLATVGAMPIGLALVAPPDLGAHLDAALGFAFVISAGYILTRDPREALWIAAAAFILHALVNLAHRPGWLPVELAPRWYLIGCAVFDVYLASLCFLARRH